MRSMADPVPSIPPGRIVLTYDDYVELPNDGKRYQILEGALDVTPAPTPKHQTVSLNLTRLLDTHVREHGLGQILCSPIDVILSATTIAQPDIIFIASGRKEIISARAIEGPPDLVVEILSPSTARTDRSIKSILYARFGVRHYWLVDPVARTLETYELAGTQYTGLRTFANADHAETTLFPGLAIDLADVWA